jgi:hypothetical protein
MGDRPDLLVQHSDLFEKEIARPQAISFRSIINVD